MPVFEAKKEIRRQAKESRTLWADQAGPDAGASLAGKFLENAVLAGTTGPVAGYWPMSDEINVRPLMETLHQRNLEIALPVVLGAEQPLVFRRWVPGLSLEEGSFSTRHPAADQPDVTPGMLLVPLLAFDENGMRLGWGGGFYDRTLEALRAEAPVLAAGVAYHGQRVDHVPHSSTDQPLDWIVTDRQAQEVR